MSMETNHITHLYLVRHAETDYNRNKIVQGRGVDVPLNELGLSQASELARRFQSIQLDAIYSSTLIRAVQTAKLIAGYHQVPLIQMRDLEEMSWGIYEGRARSPELIEAFKKMKDEWGNGNYAYGVEAGESILDVEERGLRAVNYIARKHIGDHVVLVAHGRFLRVILASILDGYGLKRMEEFDMQNTSFNHLIFHEGRFEAKVLQSTTHLDVING